MSTVVPAVEIRFFRSVFSVGIGVMLCRTVYTEPVLPFQSSNTTMTLLFIRGLTDYLASTLFYFGCAQLGLGLATLITFTNPFWAAILAKLWLGEPYDLKDFALASVAFVGITCATLPNLQSESMKTVNLGMIVLVSLCGVLQACTYCLIKRIHGEVHFMQMTVAYGLCGIFVGSGVMGVATAAKQPLAEPASVNVLGHTSVMLLTSLVACLAITAQIFLNLGIASGAQATVAALIRTADIPLALVFQYFLIGEVPQKLEIVGACIVLAACVALTVLKQATSNASGERAQGTDGARGTPTEPFLGAGAGTEENSEEDDTHQTRGRHL